MKHFWLTAALFLGVWATSMAQQNLSVLQANSQDQYFSIHLGSFVKLNPQDFTDVRDLGYLYAESFNEHLTHLFLGEFQSEAEADVLLRTIHAKGFPDAYVSRRKLNNDQKVEVIQLGIELVGEKIAWQRYKNALPLSTIINKEQLRIVAGPFPSHEATVQQVEKFKEVGYGNAFIRTEYSLRLHPVTDFEAPDLFLPDTLEPSLIVAQATTKTTKPPITQPELRVADVEEVVVAKGAPVPNATAKQPAASSEIVVPKAQVIPKDYEPEFIAKAGITSGLAMPNIRPEIKRTSAIELQKVLKLNKYYEGSLDGFYGKGTSMAYHKYINENNNWQQYAMLSQHKVPLKSEVKNEALLDGINMIIDAPTKAKEKLEKSNHPMAKAYLAYILHETGGELLTINDLMNAANQACFKGYVGTSTFDHSATYSYQHLPQLLDHLAQLHGIKTNIPVPCWMFQKHEEVAKDVFSKVEGYTLEGCDPFMDWDVMQNLNTIAGDLEHKFQVNTAAEAKAASDRSKLFVNPTVLTESENASILDWNKEFWKKMDMWSTENPLQDKITTSLKVAFFQSQVLIEDYFIDKGYTYRQAKGLALTTLRTIVRD